MLTFFILNSDGIIEAPGIIILFACLLRCLQYSLQSSAINTFKQIRAFWLAAVLVFFAVIRRELNYLPDLLVPTDFILLSHSYDWWEDVLTIVYLLIIGLLAYAWRYLWAILKKVPVSLYLTVVALVLLEYMGENAIMIPEALGVIIEELSETAVYGIALIYLWRLNLNDYDCQSKKASELHYQTASH
ncbi:hypothetical protein ACT3N8_03890 [Psychrobacter aquimaris]|uniref:hypothetical protein n=1 Tax=Psychrobacter aquimaris TaxID=292733 RepID=UPI003FCFFFA7